MGRRHSAWSAAAAALLVLTACGAQTSSPAAAPPTLGTDPLRTDAATTPTVAVSSPPSDVGEASSGPPETTPQDVAGALFDVSSGAYFLIDLGSDPSTHGHVEVVIPRVGMAWSEAPASFVRRIASTSTIRYDGRGFLDEKARLDPSFPMATRPSGLSRPVSLRIEATLTQGLSAGHATVWLDGRRYRIVAAPPHHDAGPAVRDVLEALRHERWAALYRLTSRSARSTVSEQSFIRAMTRLSPSDVVVRVTGPTRYTVSGGVGYAPVPVLESFTARGDAHRRHKTIVLVREPGGWRFQTSS